MRVRSGHIALSALAGLMLAACGGVGKPGAGGPSTPDQRTVGIYSAVIRYLAGTESFYDHIYVQDRPCQAEPRPVPGHEDMTEDTLTDECGPPLTEQEQRAILDRLGDLPKLEFVSDADAVQDRIFDATGAGTGDDVLIRYGRIDDQDGDRLEIPGSAYCGGVCGHWMTLIVERRGEGWAVTGTTGPIGIA